MKKLTTTPLLAKSDKPPEEFYNILKKWGEDNYELLSLLPVEKKLDLLMLLKLKLVPNNENSDHKLFWAILRDINLSNKGLLKAYFNNIFPWERIERIYSSIRLDDNYFNIQTDKWNKTFQLKDISVEELKLLNVQLKQWWWNPEEVASVLTTIKDAQLAMLDIQWKIEWIDPEAVKNSLVVKKLNELHDVLPWIRMLIVQKMIEIEMIMFFGSKEKSNNAN